MAIEVLDKKVQRIEDELEKLKEKELYIFENIENEIKLLDISVKELNKRAEIDFESNHKSIEKKMKENNIYKKKNKCVKAIKKHIFFDLKLLKNEKKKIIINLLGMHLQSLPIHEIVNEINQSFLELNVRRQYLFKSVFEKLAKCKKKFLFLFGKYLQLQKDVNFLFHLINNNALKDIYILNNNGLFFKNEMIKKFQHF